MLFRSDREPLGDRRLAVGVVRRIGVDLLAHAPLISRAALRHWPAALVVTALFVAHAVQFTFWLPTLKYDTNRNLVQLGAQLRGLTQVDDHVLVVMQTAVEGPEMMYYARRRGRVVAASEVDETLLGAFSKRGSRQHFVAFAEDMDDASVERVLGRACRYTFEPRPSLARATDAAKGPRVSVYQIEARSGVADTSRCGELRPGAL